MTWTLRISALPALVLAFALGAGCGSSLEPADPGNGGSGGGGVGGDGGSVQSPTPEELARAAEDARQILDITRAIPELRERPEDISLLRGLGLLLPFAVGGLGTLGLGGFDGIHDMTKKGAAEPCWAYDGTTLVYDGGPGGRGSSAADCLPEFYVMGELADRDGSFEIDLAFLGKQSGGTRNRYDGSVTIEPTGLDGRLAIVGSWDGGYVVDLAVTYDAIVLDDAGCPTGGALTVDATVNGFRDDVTAVFGPGCDDVDFVLGERSTSLRRYTDLP